MSRRIILGKLISVTPIDQEDARLEIPAGEEIEVLEDLHKNVPYFRARWIRPDSGMVSIRIPRDSGI